MNFIDFLEEQLKNPEFRKEYEALELEYAVKHLLIHLRTDIKAILNALFKRIIRKP